MDGSAMAEARVQTYTDPQSLMHRLAMPQPMRLLVAS